MEQTHEIGQKVKTSQTLRLYASEDAEIVAVERVYKEFDEEKEAFVLDGLLTLEGTIKNIGLPYEFDGETLKVHHKNYTRLAKFYDYAYTIKILKTGYSVVLSEASFKVLN